MIALARNSVTPSALDYEPLLYLMLKPPLEIARMIHRLRLKYGIESRYGHERLHTTLLPLGDERYLSPGQIASIHAAMALLRAEPCEIRFDRLNGNALVGGAMPGLRAIQRAMARLLLTQGFPVPDYEFRPHLSVTYGERPGRNGSIPPIAWRAEEVLLIRSLKGRRRHVELARWPLRAAQLSFDW